MKQQPGFLYAHDGSQWRRGMSAVCVKCQLEFVALAKEIKKGGGKFCSRHCQRAHQALVNAADNKRVGLTAAERAHRYKQQVAPEVLYAHKQVEYAIARGELIRQPCEKCGAEKVDAHHDDYSAPLSVRWLCRAHHLEHHRACDNWRLRKAA